MLRKFNNQDDVTCSYIKNVAGRIKLGLPIDIPKKCLLKKIFSKKYYDEFHKLNLIK